MKSKPVSHPHPFAAATGWNLEQSYETRPRAHKSKKLEKKESTRLPIKTASGEIQQVAVPEEEKKKKTHISAFDQDSDDDGAEDFSGFAENVVVEEKKAKVPERQRIVEAKEELAKIAITLNEDPEEHTGLFKRLREISEDPNITIRKLALATQLAVYKDVIPGYRIRPLTSEEEKAKVGKEVKKLRNFEHSLLAGYQDYVEGLGKLSRAHKTGYTNPTITALGDLATTCACTLLSTVPHFNFRQTLLKILTERISTKRLDATFTLCLKTLQDLFATDIDGHASLEAVQLLARMMKAKNWNIHESVLNTFLSLRLLSELDVKASQNTVENPRKRKKKQRVHRSQKARKLAKEEEKEEKELREADASVSYEEREALQSEMLKCVFATYFRILKARVGWLMGATLEGLAKYSHLINMDFFGDLLVALKELIASATESLDSDDDDSESESDSPPNTTSATATERNKIRESLLCIITAFALLSGQNTTLNVDLTYFSTHLYNTLFPLSLSTTLESHPTQLTTPSPSPSTRTPTTNNRTQINHTTTIELLLHTLHTLFFSSSNNTKKQPPLRTSAFTKRLLTTSLQTPEKSTLAEIAFIKKLSPGDSGGGMWDTEEVRGDCIGSGGFVMDGTVPEMSNPFAATAWEMVLLKKHYSPRVVGALEGLGRGRVGR